MSMQRASVPGSVIDLDAYLDGALFTARMAGSRKDLLVGRRTGHDGLRVHGDPALLKDQLDDLLREAVEHSPYRGVVTVEVSAETDHVLVTVCDQRTDALHDDGACRSLQLPKA